MASILVSGPAGAGKSALARQLWEEHPGLAIIVDFQSFYAAVTGDTRDEYGRYPHRNERLLPVVEYLRLAAITAARERDIDVIATNSDGDATRRNFLLARIGPGAIERVIDPGRAEVMRRLLDPETGLVDPECERAIDRWYGRT